MGLILKFFIKLHESVVERQDSKIEKSRRLNSFQNHPFVTPAQLQGPLRALNYLDNDDACAFRRSTISLVVKLAIQLNLGLDTINLPEVTK